MQADLKWPSANTNSCLSLRQDCADRSQHSLIFLERFTIRGVSKPETLTFTITSGKGKGEGSVTGTMAFDRKEFGMTSGIPFIKIADRVEVRVDLHGKRVSGPPLVFKE